MAQSRSITISYELHPSTDTPSTNMSASKAHDFPISSSDTADLDKYYAAVRESLKSAKNTVGDELTEWRDAVGKLELSKEPKTPKKGDDADEDEEEEEEEEEAT